MLNQKLIYEGECHKLIVELRTEKKYTAQVDNGSQERTGKKFTVFLTEQTLVQNRASFNIN